MYDGGTTPVDRRTTTAVDHEVLAQGPVAAGGRPSAFRSAVLVVLHERERDSFDLGVRLSEAGFNPRLVSLLDVVLRSMEHDGLVHSWAPAGGVARPGRRVYGLTSNGCQQLRDAVPERMRRSDAFGGLIGRCVAPRQGVSRRSGPTQGAQERREVIAWW